MLSFVWPLPSRCERVGLGAPGCGNNYPEHSCDLLGLVNIPEPTPLNFANQLGVLAGTQRAASGRWPLQKKDWGVLTASSLSGKLVEPSRLASVCPRNLPTHLENVYKIFAQSRTCYFLSQRECICGTSKSNIWRRRKAASPYLTSSGCTFICHTRAVKNGG